ncbi:hypothetical protein [Acetobacter sp.]
MAPSRILCLGQTQLRQLVNVGVQRGLLLPTGAEDPDVAQHCGIFAEKPH